jgi:hypothetical protein
MAYEYEYTNGAPTPRPAPRERDPRQRREQVNFLTNVPVKVALAYPDGLYTEGTFGPRVMFTLTDGRVMFLDPPVAAKINVLEPQPGQPFWIVKRSNMGRNRKATWDVYAEDPTPRPDESTLGRDLRLSVNQVERQKAQTQNRPPATSPEAQQPTAGIVRATTTGDQHTAKPQPAWHAAVLDQTNLLTDAFAAALKHAGQYGQAVKAEDVRTLLVTAFIQWWKLDSRF